MTSAGPCPRCRTVGLTDENQTCQTCGYPAPCPTVQDVVVALGCLALLEPVIARLGFRIGHDVAARADHSRALLLRDELRAWLLKRFIAIDPPMELALQGLLRQTIRLAKET